MHYWIFAGGAFFGICVGIIIISLFHKKHNDDVEQNIIDAYWRGWSRANHSATLRSNVMAKDRGIED